MNKKNKIIIIYLLALCTIGLDQIIKIWALYLLPKEGYLFFLQTGGLGLKFFKNTGIAFGVPLNGWLLFVVLIFILTFLVYSLIKAIKQKEGFKSILAIILILLGAGGNLIDRLVYGYVIDFIQIFWWPAFNLADGMIVAGAILWVWLSFRGADRLKI